MFQKRILDAKVWKTGHSLVVTIPEITAKQLQLKIGDYIQITIQKNKKRGVKKIG